MNESDLHPYQTYGVDHILNNDFAALFYDMGLGKTITTATAFARMLADMEITKTLIVAPKLVATQSWKQELSEWEQTKHLRVSVITGNVKQRIAALEADADVYTISRDSIVWLQGYFNTRKWIFDLVVIDEFSSFKAHDSQRFKAMKILRAKTHKLVGLTGTPIPNSYLDLWAPVYLLDQGKRLGKNITAYREAFFRRKANGFGYEIIPGMEEEIQSRISDICISMRAEDWLTLPEKIETIIPLGMPEDLRSQYKEFEKEYVLDIIDKVERVAPNMQDFIIAANAAALCNKLLQFSSGAMYDDNKNIIPIHDIKLDKLAERLEEAEGSPMLCFYWYKCSLARINEKLKKYKPYKIETPQDVNDWNAGKIPFAVLQPASKAHGLNLQKGGNRATWFDLTWSSELWLQGNARIYRQGQKKVTFIDSLVMSGTMENKQLAALGLKQQNQNELMGAVNAVDAVRQLIAKYRK